MVGREGDQGAGRDGGREVRTVLVVDDDEAILAAWQRGAGRATRLVPATTAEQALAIARGEPIELAVIDLRLGGESGLDVVRQLRRDHPGLQIAICSAYLSVVAAVAAVRAGADLVLWKPITFKDILARAGASSPVPDLDETPTLARVEWEHITRVLSDCNGNVSMAARRLGIYRSSLQRRLRKHAPRE